MWRPSTRLRALEEIRQIKSKSVYWSCILARNIVSLISTVLPFTGSDIGDPEFPSWITTNSSRRRFQRPALLLPLVKSSCRHSGPRTQLHGSGSLRGSSPFATSPTLSRGTTTCWRPFRSTLSAWCGMFSTMTPAPSPTTGSEPPSWRPTPSPTIRRWRG
jgi:hypothetical protein